MTIDATQAAISPYSSLWRVQPSAVSSAATTAGAGASQPTVASAGVPPLSGGKPLLAASDRMLLQRRDLSSEEARAYEHLLTEFAASQRRGEDPVDFLKTLSGEGLDLLKKAHSFPASMQVDLAGMDRESAINFVVPDSRQVVLNNDGFTSSANGALSFRFPPVNAPQSVKDAWAEATAGLSEKDVLLFQGSFLPLMIEDNVTRDSAGNPVGLRGPDDPGYHNPFAEPGFSYAGMVEDRLASLEHFKAHYSSEQYDWQKGLLTRLAQAMDNHGVA